MTWPNEHCEPLLALQKERLVKRGINYDDIEDIMQDTRIYVLQHARPDASYNEMNRWIWRICGHRIMKMFEANRKGVNALDGQEDEDVVEMMVTDKGATAKMIEDKIFCDQLLSEFRPKHRELLSLYANGMNMQEAEAFLGHKRNGIAGTMKKRIAKVREKHGQG